MRRVREGIDGIMLALFACVRWVEGVVCAEVMDVGQQKEIGLPFARGSEGRVRVRVSGTRGLLVVGFWVEGIHYQIRSALGDAGSAL